MLEIERIDWSELQHAYGGAGDVPAMLEAMYAGGQSREFWTDAWSCLCHQGDVYTASLAALPFIVDAGIEVLRTDKVFAYHYLALPVEVEKARGKFPHLKVDSAYSQGLVRINELIQLCEQGSMDATTRQVLLEAKGLLRGLGLLQVQQRDAGEGELL
ncbi:hypothetical protein Rhal01_02204 [Rubritalea halochordaticola]|uniref:Uncharacterized protein n=1 Tax=Rubritalea halochordaticola TaxID=714537 RepID=A0ABP9V005_9BACT